LLQKWAQRSSLHRGQLNGIATRSAAPIRFVNMVSSHWSVAYVSARKTFVTESFIDEMAAAAKQDAVAYRRALLDKSLRAKAVLDRRGKSPLGRGLAQGKRPRRFAAVCLRQLPGAGAEVEVAKDGAVRVRRDGVCGRLWHRRQPDTVQAQIQSGIIFLAAAALYGEITLKNGRVEQTNFDSYQMLRINDAPAIEIYIVKITEPPGGMGETGTSAIVPAIANAIFAATGKRLRKMLADASLLKQPA
jgi:isoquinoline 1-oxidoreductase subunit beta